MQFTYISAIKFQYVMRVIELTDNEGRNNIVDHISKTVVEVLWCDCRENLIIITIITIKLITTPEIITKSEQF